VCQGSAWHCADAARCDVAEAAQVHCYFISQGAYGPSMHAISCAQMPGF
jgi:hypothetical protein